MRFVLTRPAPEGEASALRLRQAGLDVVALPLIGITEPDREQAETLRRCWRSLHEHRAVMFVSAAAVQHFFGAAAPGSRWPAATRAWAPGPGTAAALSAQGVPADAIDTPAQDAAQFDSEALWATAGGRIARGDSVLIVRGAEADRADDAGSGHGRAWMAEQLAGAGAVVSAVAAYRRGKPAWSDAESAQAMSLAGPGTAWVFSNSEAIAHLFALLPVAAEALRQGTALATHPRIAASANAAGFARVVMARPGVVGLEQAMTALDRSIESTE
ncbi:uroporphyrinogen-III synthase [Xylophilus sp. GOD-11R]|uniref:uroporphyrinogen-III synthase n=1 Tax=Xylophilus sp. GOD-11R TaxID=3089814 RepID=UPI00298CE9F0|nr:uroporphyrinogen-III synthase [Xylophilus sp. GOD-11R]WPB58055.1 uroporphyrinogen-III synthase [Xylophilus sp. GOD-11R]